MCGFEKSEILLLKMISKGEFCLTFHAQERMDERGITVGDIVNGAKTVNSVVWQEAYDSYLIQGNDLYGLPVSIVANIIDKVVIITVFLEDKI